MIELLHKIVTQLLSIKGTLFLLLAQWLKVTALKCKKFAVKTVDSKSLINKNY